MQRTFASVVASSLLGVIAVAALVTGVFFYFGSWASQQAAGTGTTPPWARPRPSSSAR